MTKTRTIKNLSDLRFFARQLAESLRGGDIVALSGELGAGKTTLIQNMAQALGLSRSAQSPSFVIFKIYPINHGNIKQLCHVDLYRLKNFDEPHGFEEYLGDKNTVCFIEWAEKMKDLLPQEAIWIKIQTQLDSSRIITKNPA